MQNENVISKVIDTSRILIGYNLQNIALLINIYRWELILKVAGTIKNGLTVSEDPNESSLPFYQSKIVLVNILAPLASLILYILSIVKNPQFKLLFFLFQGLTINLLFITFFYIRIYRYFKAYNLGLLEKYQTIYQKEDIAKIHQTIKEVKIFFTYIIIVLILQSTYIFWAIFSTRSGAIDLQWNDRINDILFVLI